MKKLLTVIGVSLLFSASVMAQGRIDFNNTSLTTLKITDGTTTLVLGTASTATFGIGPASVRIQLFAGLTSSALSPVLIGTLANKIYVTNTASTVASVQGTFPGGDPLVLFGFDGSQPVFLQFTAASINGLFWTASPIIQVNLATGGDPDTQVFSPTADANHWNGLIIGVPEPSSVALLGLGCATMLLARRKK